MLVHCWNGLHYAGMVSALALRQFCGFSAEQAEAYWRTMPTAVPTIRSSSPNIHNFKPIAGLSPTAAEQQALCPDVSMGYMPTDNIVAAALISSRTRWRTIRRFLHCVTRSESSEGKRFHCSYDATGSQQPW